MPGKHWPKERLEALFELIKKPMTAGEIGAALGVSRCSVIGKLRKMGLPLPNAGNRHAYSAPVKARMEANAKRWAHKMAEKRKAKEKERFRRLLKETRSIPQFVLTCKYINGPTSIDNFCNKPTIHNTSWCEEHYPRVFDLALTAQFRAKYGLSYRRSWRR